MRVLQSEIEEFADNVTLSKKLSRLQQLEVSKLEDIAKDVFGTGARLLPFGSIAAGLGTVNSDVDVALSLGDAWDADMFARGAVGAARLVTHEAADSSRLSEGVTLRGRRRERERAKRKKRGWAQNDPVRGERVRILQRLARAVKKRLRQTVDIDLVLGAKVPVMKLTTSSGVEIDCTVQTRVHSGSITCDVLRMLAESDVRIRQLTLVGALRHRFTGSLRSFTSSDNACGCGSVSVSPSVCVFVSVFVPNPHPSLSTSVPAIQVVKSWARARGVKDAFEGTLNSMGHTLLLLYFLAKQRAIPDLFAPHITLLNHQRRKKEDEPSGRSRGGEGHEGVEEARGAADTALKGCQVTARVRMQVIRSDGCLQHLALHLDLDGACTACCAHAAAACVGKRARLG